VLAGGRKRADFVRNAMAEPRVTVRIGETEGDATARVVDPGTDEDALARRLLLAKYQVATSDDLEHLIGASRREPGRYGRSSEENVS